MKRLFLSLIAFLSIVIGAKAQDMKATPLSFEAVEAGTVKVYLDEGSTLQPIQYKLNSDDWTEAAWDTDISVAAGDVVSFRGNNGTCYKEEDNWTGFHFECSNNCYVYGNIMSLIDQDNFATNTTLTKTYTFFHLFERADFEPNTTILNHPTKDIVLPATTLTDYCYDGLFNNCKGITRAPVLPATNLADCCYCMMFADTSITEAPELPATTLADACYSDMFMNCKQLQTAPLLPAPVLAMGCYSNMFSGCTNLNAVTCLATDISADYCTVSWLDGVAASGTFTKAPDMTAWTTGDDGIPEGWTVEDYSAEQPFNPYTEPLTFECTVNNTLFCFKANSINVYDLKYRTYNVSTDTWTDWQNLSAGYYFIVSGIGSKVQFKKENTDALAQSYNSYCSFDISSSCYVYGNVMSLFNFATTLEEPWACCRLFYGNTKIKTHPSKDLVLGATTLSDNCYMYMFKNCTKLTKMPAISAATMGVNSCYRMFEGCTGITAKPVLPATTLAKNCYNGMFYDCTGLIVAPDLPVKTLAEACYGAMFCGCTALTVAPSLPATTLAPSCYGSMFEGCTSLSSAPSLPATTLASDCYNHMFAGTSITEAPVLPATQMEHKCYYYMFYGCTGLTDAPALPSTSLATWCYNGMFYNCTNLVTVPSLPATTMYEQCYADMFNHCVNLETAPELPATTLAKHCYSHMFSSCSKLKYVKCLATDVSAEQPTYRWLNCVAPTGTFVKAKMGDYHVGNYSVDYGDVVQDGYCDGIPEGWTVQILEDTPTTVTITANSDGEATPAYWTSFYREIVSCTADENTTVYTAKLNDDKSKVILHEVADKVIPAGNAVVLKSTQPEITMTYNEVEGTLADNDLKGTAEYYYSISTDDTVYMLTKGNHGVGFYNWTSTGYTIPDHRAFLTVESGSASAPEFLSFDNTTGINAVETHTATDGAYYDLSGRRISGKPQHGIYIKDGRKVVVR